MKSKQLLDFESKDLTSKQKETSVRLNTVWFKLIFYLFKKNLFSIIYVLWSHEYGCPQRPKVSPTWALGIEDGPSEEQYLLLTL